MVNDTRALVTGGAGFIGSHLVDALVRDGYDVVVLDDLETGFRENVHPGARLVIGSIADADAVRDAMTGCELVFHQAAHKAVLRSVEHPIPTDTVNTHGTLVVLQTARELGVRRVVHASSSSVYGGAAPLPTPEDAPLRPRSPYAVSKLAAEEYCRVFAELYELETVALRYFNVYGPRQRPDATYAAVIPLFVDALLGGRAPVVHGDGLQSRDFTYVSDVVDANLAAAAAPAAACSGRAYNVAAGNEWTLLDILRVLGELLGTEAAPDFTGARPGDVRHSRADATAAAHDLGFRAAVELDEGLRRTVDWLRSLPGADPEARTVS
jgi:UDP-glucose 4-epimerase